MNDMEQQATGEQVDQRQYKTPPATPDPLVKVWQKRIAAAKKHWEKYHKRVQHNRRLVAGFDWSKDPDSCEFYTKRANLIQGAMTAILPNLYARNPEMSVTGNHPGRDLKLLCKTIEKVTNRQLIDAKLKKRAKASIRAALTCSIGAVKVMYQRDMREDPFIKGRIQDTQDNIAHIEELLMRIDDPDERACQEATKAELEETMRGLQENTEIVAGEGMVIDRILTEHILLDTALAEFEDYPDSDWIVQLIPMKKSTAEGIYKYKLDKATTYKEPASSQNSSGKIFSGESGADGGDCQILICEIWDKQGQRVYTMVEGIDYWLRDPFSPKCTGERWYPFFLFPFQLVDGCVVGPSLVDLTERLEKEHNDLRDKESAHRDLIKPGWVASGVVEEKSIRRYQDSVMGEITIIDTNGVALSSFIAPKQHPQIDPAIYDSSKVRYDWEMVSGMQDASRSSVVEPKTATEASIANQALSGRVSELRDQTEDVLQELSQYAAQILLQELTEAQVERIMGPNKTGPMTMPDGSPMIDPATGQPVIGVLERSYEWPRLSREEVFDLVQLQIRAGTTGEPDKLEQQETWIKMMPVIQPLITQIMQMQMQGVDASALVALLRETVARFDDKMDIETIIPKLKPLPPPPPAAPAPPPGGPTNLHAVA